MAQQQGADSRSTAPKRTSRGPGYGTAAPGTAYHVEDGRAAQPSDVMTCLIRV